MTPRLDGIKLALCQMNIVPGRPDLNTAYMVDEIKKAAERGVDIIIFPEMATTGYFIGDLYEDEAFLRDVEYCNTIIRASTQSGIVAVVGTPILVPQRKGEDGNQRLANAGVVYANGRYLGHAIKTLQPNYRMFDDDRHFFSLRKAAFEEQKKPEKLITPVSIPLTNGRAIRLGVTLCEDIWHEFYPLNPAMLLAQKGADLICNLSASPWTWQKNRKRHEIIKELAAVCNIPFVYVNNTGIQNTGKNIIIFDGSSTIYNDHGQVIFEAAPYVDGTQDFVFQETMPMVSETAQDDTKELYCAIRCAAKEFFAALPPEKRKVVIGISGGIDSSLSAAMYVDALGAEHVIGINMPSKFSSDKTQNLARTLAENLGISYEVKPIQDIVDTIARQTDVAEGSLAYENIQARVRMEILAATSQRLQCLFAANPNKVELSFGYGTLYADMAGALALIGDLLKREVYQLADYMNRKVFGRQVIPQECFDITPTAELRLNQRDPFDYGRIDQHGYHEEMVRAFTEFRRNPEWFLDHYRKGLLENAMKLEAGKLKKLFPTSRHFIHDLEKHWRMFSRAYFKRIQAPPIPIVSKRAFGTDLRETLASPHITHRSIELRKEILGHEPARVVIYGGSFNPPCTHHCQIVMQLLAWFNHVVIVPCGIRNEKDSLKAVALNHRKEMALLTFGDFPNVSIDASDLDNNTFTPTYALDERYKELYPDKEIWHAVGGDLINGGKEGKAEIQRLWKKGQEVWQTLNFVVMNRPGFNLVSDDLPPLSEVIEIEDLSGSSTDIRERISRGEDVKELVTPEIYAYIERFRLYART